MRVSNSYSLYKEEFSKRINLLKHREIDCAVSYHERFSKKSRI